ncbi:uncharacterized protein EV154DRAFT_531596 [Mucor mucedo]|uniref:uncharacterized protein n=1 Tax=Mucor mucedo TaxID=29922 RepID=UPI00221EAE00|nr:uncharacterized protein EV154DRAFT_531596 [Mucor mucedo]KAI7867896.1 hypothetical protein EV154DRAFT_531596 [Mucor mucedo]
MFTYFEEWLDPTLKMEAVDLSSLFPLDFLYPEGDELTSSSPCSSSGTFSSCSSSGSTTPEFEPFVLLDLPHTFVFPEKQKPFGCHICSRSFARKHDLHRHIRVHTGAKPYSCLSCAKSFARTDALKRHLRMEEHCRTSPVIQAMKDAGNRRYRNL